MTNLTTKLNKLVLDDSPSEKLINACAEIDIESCFDPIFEPPICWRLYVTEMSRLPTR